MKKKQTITHEKVQDAVQSFLRKGGAIDKLPEQKSSRTELIGQEKYDSYDTPFSLFSN